MPDDQAISQTDLSFRQLTRSTCVFKSTTHGSPSHRSSTARISTTIKAEFSLIDVHLYPLRSTY